MSITENDVKNNTELLFNSIKEADPMRVEKAIKAGANVQQLFYEEKTGKYLSSISMLLNTLSDSSLSEKEKELDKTRGNMVRIFNLLIKANASPLIGMPLDFIEPELKETHLISKLIEESFAVIEKRPNLLLSEMNSKKDKWIFLAVEEKKIDLVSDFVTKGYLNEKELPPAFWLDSTDKSLLATAIDTRNDVIIDLLLKNINEKNVNVTNDGFSLLDEVLFNAKNDSITKMPYYQKAVDYLLNNDAKINDKLNYGKTGETLILQNKIKLKGIQPLKNTI